MDSLQSVACREVPMIKCQSNYWRTFYGLRKVNSSIVADKQGVDISFTVCLFFVVCVHVANWSLEHEK